MNHKLLPFGSSFAVLELASIGMGYQVVQYLLKNNLSHILEAYPHSQGFFIYLNDKPDRVQTALQWIQEEFKKHIINSTHIENIKTSVIEALYSLNKTKLEKSLLVVETQTLRSCLIAAQSAALKNIAVYEILTPRNLNSKSCILLTSSTEKLNNLIINIKEVPEILKIELVEDLSSSFLQFFEGPVTSQTTSV